MRLALLAASLVPLAALAGEPVAMSPDEVPAKLAPLVARANAAAEALRDRLYGRLNVLLAEKGSLAAVDVCRAEAPRYAKEVGEEHHLEVGRTSHKVRNPANAPRAWAAPYVRASAGKKGSEVKAIVVDAGDRIGLLRPIAVMPACLRCHGPVEGMEPSVRAFITAHYPRDQAVGFANGDLRGFIWVEMKKP